MKTIISIFILMFVLNIAIAQNVSLKAEMIKADNEYLKVLSDGKVECSFYLYGIQTKTQAANIEKYIRGYRGVEEFNLLFDVTKNTYKAKGVFYNQANWNYLKYLFQLIKVEQVNINNQWKNLEPINNL